MNKEKTTKNFAKAINKAVELREDSFDHKMAAQMRNDYNKCYKLSLEEACIKSAKENGFGKEIGFPLYLGL